MMVVMLHAMFYFHGIWMPRCSMIWTQGILSQFFLDMLLHDMFIKSIANQCHTPQQILASNPRKHHLRKRPVLNSSCELIRKSRRLSVFAKVVFPPQDFP